MDALHSAKNFVASPLKKRITWSNLPENSDGSTSAKIPKGTPLTILSPNTGKVLERASQDPPHSAHFIGRLFSYFKASSTLADNDVALKQPVLTKDTTFDELDTLTVAELIERLENMSKTVFNETQITWSKTDFESIRAIPSGPLLLPASSHPRAGEFAQTDSKGQAKELEADIHLLQAKACWLSRDYRAMAVSAKKALDASENFAFPAYTAKICFYIAVSYCGLQDFENGLLFLGIAQECKGVYREGELINWVQKEAILHQSRVSNQSPKAKSKKFSIYSARNTRKGSTSNYNPKSSSKWWHTDAVHETVSPGIDQSSEGWSQARSLSTASSESRSSFTGNIANLALELENLSGNGSDEVDEDENGVDEE